MFWYHAQTKHSYASVRQGTHRLRWEIQPRVFKSYPHTFKRYALDITENEDRFLYHIAGINAKKSYPGVEYYLRINPAAGALYPNELYVQIRGIQGKADGIYHFDVAASALTLLYALDGDEGIEPYLGYRYAMRGYLFLVSMVPWRSSWKYRDRAFRYCLLDGGHILGAIEAAALLKPHATTMRYAIDKERLHTMLGLNERERLIGAASVAVPLRDQSVRAAEFALPYVDATGSYEPNAVIEKAYEQTRRLDACRAQHKAPQLHYDKQRWQEAIFTRRSAREFTGEAITKGQFLTLMEVVNQAVLSDCDEEVTVHTVVNRVLDMPQGIYVNGCYQAYEDFSRQAGYLCLEQYHLGTQGALTFFMTSQGENYQALYQKAGIIGQRLYVVATYLGLGASGIGAYYDDEVVAFLDLPNDTMVLYAFAVGRVTQ